MDMMNQHKRSGGRTAVLVLMLSLVACLVISAAVYWQITKVDALAREASPDRLMESAYASGLGAQTFVDDQLAWLGGVAERMAVQAGENEARALLPNVREEREVAHIALLDKSGEGILEDGTLFSAGGAEVVVNALNSPQAQAVDFAALPGLGNEAWLLSAVAFENGAGDRQVLLAAQHVEAFTSAQLEQGAALLVSQRGDVIARTGELPSALESAQNILDALTAPEIEGTSANALHAAFLDGERGIAWASLDGKWVSLLYQQVEGTNWMAVSLVDNGAIGLSGATLHQAIILVGAVAAGAAVLLIALAAWLAAKGAAKRARVPLYRASVLDQDDLAAQDAHAERAEEDETGQISV